jgi:hypothetical protein
MLRAAQTRRSTCAVLFTRAISDNDRRKWSDMSCGGIRVRQRSLRASPYRPSTKPSRKPSLTPRRRSARPNQAPLSLALLTAWWALRPNTPRPRCAHIDYHPPQLTTTRHSERMLPQPTPHVAVHVPSRADTSFHVRCVVHACEQLERQATATCAAAEPGCDIGPPGVCANRASTKPNYEPSLTPCRSPARPYQTPLSLTPLNA